LEAAGKTNIKRKRFFIEFVFDTMNQSWMFYIFEDSRSSQFINKNPGEVVEGETEQVNIDRICFAPFTNG